MYGHVITKFSGMSIFPYPGCSAGVRFARESSAINHIPIVACTFFHTTFLEIAVNSAVMSDDF